MDSPPLDPVLSKWWHNYQDAFITSKGRVRRPQNDNDTVSEGQAYAMLAAVLVDDEATFDKLFKWTDTHLSRRNQPDGDHLLGWHWQSGKVIDWMPASDADCDFALALLLASQKWEKDIYIIYSCQVISAIMSREVAKGPGGRLYLLPGLWGREQDGSLVQNPSYYSPASFRLFHRQTKDSRWLDLVETSYFVWEHSAKSLGKFKGSGLQPDWCLIRSDETFAPAPQRTYDYGWEAMRMPMRLGLDFLWFEEKRALSLLKNGIMNHSSPRSMPVAVHKYSGERSVSYDSLASTAMVILAFRLLNQQRDTTEKAFLDSLLSPDNQEDYYGQSLSTFPLCHFNNRLHLPQSSAKHSPR